MWRKPVVWIALVVLSLAGAGIAGTYFDRAFPVVSLELELDRAEALERARDHAVAADWPTAGFRQAASFGLRDRMVQTYVELEAGGAGAWQRILASDPYRPYVWRVRQFEEGETHEAEIRFAPDGTPVGFRLTLPEDEPGAVLDADSARVLADAGAAAWGVDLSTYRLVEVSDELLPGGRLDRTFVYERPGELYGEARARLRVTVAGDRVGEVGHVIEVPEAFQRRYSELRSSNDLIALVASLAIGVLYLGGGCGLGLLLLLRAGWVRWRTAVLWGVGIGGLMFLASINQLPLAWMGYDTAVPAGSFLTEQILLALGVFVGSALFLSLVFIAGETLDRRAFPRHIQLWRSWDDDVARSDTGLGHALGGYVFTGFFVAYVVLFYLVLSRGLDWWTPAEAIVQPDLLATPFPWISGVATSLFAGFSEEALFRAVPLAGAVLLANRYGGRRAWLGAALVIQALIFAAAHANYPQQPPYARVVELFLPALALGAIYLRFGFMPAVIAHFTYDLTWFSLPLFAFEGVWFSKAITVVLGLVPLGVVVAARLRRGAAEAPEAARNAAWSPDREGEDEEAGAGGPGTAEAPPAPVDAPATPAGERPVAGRPAWLELPWIAAAGALGLVLWIVSADIRSDAPPLEVGRAQAMAVARQELVERGVELDEAEWRELAAPRAGVGRSHRFVWQTAGPGLYRLMLGEHLAGPRWEVRWARFEGPVAERAEEYRVAVGPTTGNVRYRHRLPEDRALPSLHEEAARLLAERALLEKYGMPPEVLALVTAEADQLPERMDWTFTFRVPAIAELAQGETRATVEVSGDRVTDVYRFVHVPEEWEREDRSRQTLRSTLLFVSGGLLLLLGLAAIIVGVVRWSRSDFRLAAFTTITLVVLVGAVLQQANAWPTLVAGFNTAQPYSFQLFAALAGMGIGSVVVASVMGVMAGLGHTLDGRSERPLAFGAAIGLLLAGLAAVATGRFRTGPEPSCPDFTGAGAVLPAAAPLLDAVVGYVTVTALVLGGFALLRLVAGRWAWAAVALALLAGLGIVGVDEPTGVGSWILGGVLAGALVYGIHRVERRTGPAILPGLVVVTTGAPVLVFALRNPYAGAWIGAALGLAAMVAAAVAWTRILDRHGGDTAA